MSSVRDALASVLKPLSTARPLPRELFVDEAMFQTELMWFANEGFFAGSTFDVPQPGAWSRVPIPNDRVVLVRDANLDVRALRDVCSHRAVQLLEGHEGRATQLCVRCPYHGWTYDLSGRLMDAPGMPAAFDRTQHGLARLHTDTLCHQVRVATASLSVREPGAAPSWLASMDTPLRRARTVTWEVQANWKLLVENFQESHHFPLVHPSLEAHTPWIDSHSLIESDHWLGGVMALRDDVQTVSQSGARNGRRMIVPEALQRAVHDAWLWPNLLTSLQPDYLLTYKLFPQRVDRTTVVAEIFVHAATPTTLDMNDLFAFWDRINDEDRRICERQQQGLQSQHWHPAVYAPSEDGMHAFDRIIAQRWLHALAESSQ